MKYLKDYKLFESNESEIHALCKKYGIENYTINPDGTIDVEGVNLYNNELTKLPLRFNKVTGGFYCKYNQLTSLLGAPSSVGGNFDCRNNELTSLEGAPDRVGASLRCENNKIMNIDGLLCKSFQIIYLGNNPVFDVVGKWINSDNNEELIEYFIDLDVIQGDKVIMERLKAFHEEMGLEMEIDFKEVEKYYTIIN